VREAHSNGKLLLEQCSAGVLLRAAVSAPAFEAAAGVAR